MHVGERTGGIIHSTRAVGGGAAPHVAGARQELPHLFLQRRAEAPDFQLHPLKGDRAGHWNDRVSGNWRGVPH